MRAAVLGLALLAGCAATAPLPPTGTAATPQATSPVPGAAVAQAQFAAARGNLRRIGYRNCDGYAIELFAPARLSSSALVGQALFLNSYAYRGGGAITLSLPGTATRLQRQTATGWQDLPMQAMAGAMSLTAGAGGGVAAAPLAPQLGQAGGLTPGRYRLWLGQFSAQRAGGRACAMAPVWQFDLT